MDEEKITALGAGSQFVGQTGIMRYVAGCILRERERLARAIPEHADKILDSSMDDLVFKWAGPSTPLDTPPNPHKDE